MKAIKMSKRIITVMSTAALALGAINAESVFADDLTSEIENNKVKIEEVRKKQEETEDRLKELQKEIKEKEDEVVELVKQAEEVQKEADKLKEEIAEMQEIVDAREEKLEEQARAIQTNGEKVDIVSIIIEAESLSEIIGKTKVVNSILSSNNDMLNSQIEDKKAIEMKELQAKARLRDLQSLSVELENLKGELMSKAFDEEVLLEELENERSAFESKHDELIRKRREEREQKALEEQRAREERSAREVRDNIVGVQSSEVLSLDSMPKGSSSSSVVSNATKYLGVPYVWGGGSPSGFDCSGFTQYVYQETYGINIGSWTGAQQYAGERVSVSNARPGDLLMWGKGSSTSHVAIYIGNGQFIHSPKPGDSVKITSLKHFMPNYAVRVVK